MSHIMKITLENLLSLIGEIDDMYVEEAEMAEISYIRRIKNRRVIKYSATGFAVSVGLAVLYWRFRQRKAV